MIVSDGHRLRQSWSDALNDAQAQFRHHLASTTSPAWKRIPNVTREGSSSVSTQGKARASADPDLSDVVVFRKSTKSGEIYRVVLDVNTHEDDPTTSLEAWKSVLITPETRSEWDPAVESSNFVEMFDPATRISKTNYTLGWPANPRDAVTISRIFNDATTLIDISTSLPRSPDEPAYLRPSPPYVRSDVRLYAWCIQLVQPSTQPAQPGDTPSRKESLGGKLRILCFWQHDLRSVWNLGSTTAIIQQLPAMMLGLYKTVKKRGYTVPILTGYGIGVTIERMVFEADRESLTIDYAIVPEEEEHLHSPSAALTDTSGGLDELNTLRERRRLERSIECALPSSQGWDMQISTRASSDLVSQLPWSAHAIRSTSTSPPTPQGLDKTIFRVKHSPLPNDHSILKVKVVLEASGASKGLRLNGIPHPVEEQEERDPSSFFMSKQMLQDASSATNVSFNTASSANTVDSTASTSSAATVPSNSPELRRTATARQAAAEKSIFSRVRRNYIYFSSLLQEPEAKWKRNTEARGVSVTQLDSIDPTLVVFRAEATFVGVGLWDLYAAVTSPGTRVYWDKQHEDAVLLEDVNELTELWHFKTRPAWPVNGRDSVVLKTVYKSPTTIHVFSFSADDPHLFPNIPPVEPNVIRAQVDLQGWAIESLSPTTTSLTLLEQSDPKGWSNKASIPQQMIASVAGIGEFAIKCGGPPVATRLEGAKANQIRYDHDRGNFRIEYKGSDSRRNAAQLERSQGNSSTNSVDSPSPDPPKPTLMPVIECELRCDIDTWATSLDIVVDPPPQSISCLRRHRLSTGGGGLWLTLGHDAVFAGDDRLLTIVRRAPPTLGKEKGIVMVNGAKIVVDVEELPEHEVKLLSKKKRVKPARIPLDQPPVLGVIRKRRAEWDADGETQSSDPNATISPGKRSSVASWVTSAPKMPSPLANFFTLAVGQAASTTQQAAAAMGPPTPTGGPDSVPSPTKPPMQYALEALSYLQSLRSRPSTDGWSLVSDKGIAVHRKLSPEISSAIPVHKGEKVLEGVSAEEVASIVTSYDCRKQWDDRFDSATVFEEFGAESHTSFVVTKGGFPFRDRGFYLASLTARLASPAGGRRRTGDADRSSTSSVIFCASASFSPDFVASFSPAKYNSYGLPIGRMLIDGWILETLDPYTTENYAIPSTRCTHVVAVDFAGSVPAAVNSMINGALPKSVLAVETYLKGISPLPVMRVPGSGLVIAEDNEEDGVGEMGWTIRRSDHNRTLITTKYDARERSYHSALLIAIAIAAPSVSEATAPRPSVTVLTTTAESPGITPSSTAEDLSSTPPSTIRQRKVSTVLGSPERHSSRSARSKSREALRSSSSAFTLRGEVKAPTDLILAEMVVDSKLYPTGYDVSLRSRIRESVSYVALPSPQDGRSAESVLPIAYTVHSIPSSPSHSSGLNSDRPLRHLLRFTLPTAQFQRTTIEDPLTGETRSAPVKPPWLLGLEEHGAVVDVYIQPNSDDASRGKAAVSVDGKSVPVVSEKESLVTLGRDSLEDERLDKLSIISRSVINPDSGPVPAALSVPVAVSEYLRDQGGAQPVTEAPPDGKAPEPVSANAEKSEDTAENSQAANSPTTEKVSNNPTSLLGFLNSYPNPLLRFTATSSGAPNRARPTSLSSSRKSSAQSATLVKEPSAPGLSLQSMVYSGRLYPLSTVIIIALISFLIGSLLRSLLTPADFIYVVTDLKDVDVQAGWREIKRLLEVKYIAGGWDFQVAVVRRH